MLGLILSLPNIGPLVVVMHGRFQARKLKSFNSAIFDKYRCRSELAIPIPVPPFFWSLSDAGTTKLS